MQTPRSAFPAAPSSGQFDLSLAHEGLFSVADAAGLQMTCREGSLWITLDNDTRDIVLSPGESFSTAEHRRALIFALGPSSLSLCMAPAAPSARGWDQAAPARNGRVMLALQPA
ncbi:MAG: DUF2917 domain-containing protein [Polaromonas sp.]|nr:DUF2917 domain-containing protein [Polaromonas sp.]